VDAQGDVFANHQQRSAVEPCMSAFESIELGARKSREDFRCQTFARAVAFTQIAFCGDGFQQFGSNDVNLIAMFERCIFEIRMNGNTKIGGQRPGCSRPDQYENFSSSERGIYQGWITA